MREYSKVSAQFWTGKTGRSLRGDMQTQIVALYLMTSPHSNMIGVFNCPVIYISHETGSPLEGAYEGLKKLIEGGFCTYDEDSETVWIHEMAKFQIGDSLKASDNRVKDIHKQYENLPEGPIKQGFYAKYRDSYHLPESGECDSPFQAPSKPLPSQEQEQEQEQEQYQEQEQEQEGKPSAPPLGDPAENSLPAVIEPKPKTETELQAVCRATWAAYSLAYFDRYGTEPVRNAKVSSQVKQFAQRIPRSEAPEVASFYVRHSDAFYIRKGHDFGQLLADAEKVRMEWATNQQITGTKARQNERASAMWQAVAEIEAKQERAAA